MTFSTALQSPSVSQGPQQGPSQAENHRCPQNTHPPPDPAAAAGPQPGAPVGEAEARLSHPGSHHPQPSRGSAGTRASAPRGARGGSKGVQTQRLLAAGPGGSRSQRQEEGRQREAVVPGQAGFAEVFCRKPAGADKGAAAGALLLCRLLTRCCGEILTTPATPCPWTGIRHGKGREQVTSKPVARAENLWEAGWVEPLWGW